MLKPLVPKFRPNLSALLRDIAEKGSCEAETDSGCLILRAKVGINMS